MVSTDGQAETSKVKSNGQHIKCDMIGESNEVQVILNGERMNALLDSGSMITTLSEKKYKSLLDKPELRELSALGLQISVADGSILQYKGFIECTMKLLDLELFVPIVIGHETEFKKNCPVIVGTNILRICREYFSHVSILSVARSLAVGY